RGSLPHPGGTPSGSARRLHVCWTCSGAARRWCKASSRSRRSMAKRVLLVTRDLLFRSKLGGVVAAAGAEVSRDEAACDLAVLELGDPGATDGIGELVRRGLPVLAYGSHADGELLGAAREAGATAVPYPPGEAPQPDAL